MMGQVEYTLQGKKLFLLNFRRDFAELRDIGCGGTSDVRLWKCFKGFSHDASFPPPGPTIKPRYSAQSRTSKAAHSGMTLQTYSLTALILSASMRRPRGTITHFFGFKTRPDIRSNILKESCSVWSWSNWGISVPISSAKAREIEPLRQAFISRRKGSTTRTKIVPEAGQPWMMPERMI